jgi:type IV fimbrial biogenesis protein FimT
LLDHEEGRGVLMKALHRRAPRGMTLIELMIGMAVFALLLLMVAPSLSQWMRDTRVHSGAQALLNDLQFARAEAVRRNGPVRLQLISSRDMGCTLTSAGPHWVVNLTASVSPAGACGTAPGDTVSPYLLRLSPLLSSSTTNKLTATRQVVAFNGLGRQAVTTNPASSVATLTINVEDNMSSCRPSGATRCLRVVVSPTGDIRMCDPSHATGKTATDAMSCP